MPGPHQHDEELRVACCSQLLKEKKQTNLACKNSIHTDSKHAANSAVDTSQGSLGKTNTNLKGLCIYESRHSHVMNKTNYTLKEKKRASMTFLKIKVPNDSWL